LQNFRVPHIENSYFVYALFAQDLGGGYVKFGISGNIGKRMSMIRGSCPLPVWGIAVLDVRTKSRAKCIEKALHERFGSRKVHGEWFRFLFSSEDDKRSFNDGCRAVFLLEIGPGHWWTTISVSALDRHERQRRKSLINSSNFREIQRRAIAEQRAKRAQKELAC